MWYTYCTNMCRTEGQVKWQFFFETYKNSMRPHGHHIQKMASDISMANTCPFTSAKHALTHWKYVLSCCAQCTSIVIPGQ